MTDFVTFVVTVMEQQSHLNPLDRVFFWMLVWLCAAIAIAMLTLLIVYTIDFVSWVVNGIKAQREWNKERKFYQSINKIRNESYGANRNRKPN